MNTCNPNQTKSRDTKGKPASFLPRPSVLDLLPKVLPFSDCLSKPQHSKLCASVDAIQSALGIPESAALGYFVAVHESAVTYRGRCPRSLARMCNATDDVLAELPTGEPTESEVKAFCRSSASDHACFFYVGGWGGMRLPNARRAYAERSKWLPIMRAMRGGKCSDPGALFDRFADERIPGLAPAYFTKLMYFCCSKGNCYILDQWTARSINLIFGTGNHLIYMSSRTWVDRRNTGVQYLNYCAIVEKIADILHKSPREIEKAMFAGSAHPWRKYLKAR